MNNEYNMLTKMIRLVDLEVDDLTTEIKNCSNIVFSSEVMLKFQKKVLLLGTGVGFFLGALFNINNILYGALYNGLLGFIGAAVITSLSTLYFGSAKIICNKKIKKYQQEINASLEVKKEYEKQLLKIKEKDEVSLNDKVVNNELTDLYYLQYLIDRDNIINRDNENKSKKLTLKKK